MGKTKVSAGKPKADDVSTKKNGGITKPNTSSAATLKNVGKDIVTKAVGVKDKLKKQVVKDESEDDDASDRSESDEEDSEDSESSGSSSDEEKVTKVPAVTNGKAKVSAKESDSESSGSDSEADVGPKVAAPTKVNGKVAKANADADSSDSSESSDEEEDEDESDEDGAETEPKAKVNGHAGSEKQAKKAKTNGAKDDTKAADDSSDDDDEESVDSSSDEDDEDEEAEAPPKKRKAEETDETPAKKARVEDEGKSATLFAGNLTWNVDDDMLYEEFKNFPDLLGARVISDKATGRSRGFGYVDFANAEAAENAYNDKNGALLDGRDMRLDFAMKRTNSFNNDSPAARSSDRAKKYGDVASPESDTLFVGNLPFDVDEDGVTAFFGEVCNVKNLRMPTDQETGRRRGFAYVTFYSVEDAKTVFSSMNGSEISGRGVRLDYASGRPNRDGDSGGRGGGFGGRGGGFGGRGDSRGGRGGFGNRGGDSRGGRGGFGGRGGGGARGGRGGSNPGYQGKKTTF